jgi:hypothetical protein
LSHLQARSLSQVTSSLRQPVHAKSGPNQAKIVVALCFQKRQLYAPSVASRRSVCYGS